MDGVRADGARRPAQLDPRQLAGPTDEGLQAEAEAGSDGAADVGAVGVDDVEVRAGAEVNDDGRPAELDPRGEGVGEPIGAGLRRAVDPDVEHSRPAMPRRRWWAPRRHALRRGVPRSPASGGTTLAMATASSSSRRCPSRPRRPVSMAATSSGVAPARVMARHEWTRLSPSKRPIVTFVLPMSAASSFTGGIVAAVPATSAAAGADARLRGDPQRWAGMADARAKLYINTGVVTAKSDMYNVLRPLLKQTVSYSYFRGSKVESSGTGWVERIVVDHPDVASYFTPLADLPQPRLVRLPLVRHDVRAAARVHPDRGERAGRARVRRRRAARGSAPTPSRRRRPRPGDRSRATPPSWLVTCASSRWSC